MGSMHWDWKTRDFSHSAAPSRGKRVGAYRAAPGRTFIYVMEAGGRVKVGLAVSPERRLCEMQTGCADRVAIVDALPIPVEAARSIESAVHDALKWARLAGEWFALDGDEAAPVVELFAAGDADRGLKLSAALREYVAAANAYGLAERARRTRRGAEALAHAPKADEAWRAYEAAHMAAVTCGHPQSSCRL